MLLFGLQFLERIFKLCSTATEMLPVTAAHLQGIADSMKEEMPLKVLIAQILFLPCISVYDWSVSDWARPPPVKMVSSAS